MMGLPSSNDFNLDSEGHCFFCLNKILAKAKQGGMLEATPRFQKYSVHYLARHLKLDMGKVLRNKGEVDLTLLAKLRRSRLKVELCNKCNDLNKTFSGLYQQLEKLEIEISCSLNLIHGEMLAANRKDKLETNLRLNSSMRNEISQIVDVLREETIQKCSRKLPVMSPRVQMEKLTKKQIREELSFHQSNSGIANMEPETSSPEDCCEAAPNVKLEVEPCNESLSSDEDSRNCDMDSEPSDMPGVSVAGQNLGTERGADKNAFIIISTESTSLNKAGKGKYSLNTGTGSWNCGACELEFPTHSKVLYHYSKVHQKTRYKCVPCGKEFAQRNTYNRHYQSVHVGVRFKCLVCNKLFSDRDNLRTHQRKTACNKGTD